jgi:glucosamine 6-phosphate synthetase-like amidotransferase/phosphosugar isomerase protein
MCGIFGSVSCGGNGAENVVAGLKYLKYRGYDSWGVAVAVGDKVVCEKAVGSIAQAKTLLPASTAGSLHWPLRAAITLQHPRVPKTNNVRRDELCQRYITHSSCDAGRAMIGFEYRQNMCNRGDERGHLRLLEFSVGWRML